MEERAQPGLVLVNSNSARMFGLTPEERARRMARARGIAPARTAGQPALLVNTRFAFDPLLFRIAAETPGRVFTFEGVPVLAHCREQSDGLEQTMRDGAAVQGDAIETSGDFEIEDQQLRKRTRPFCGPLTTDSARSLEEAAYAASYKGVTDLLTKYLWPRLAFHLTRWASAIGITPNQVTAVGAVLCVLAAVLFWQGQYWWGMASGFGFMVLDTVDGKLARCTITSSKWGNTFDHGIDLVHPPFWWWAWCHGLGAWGLALSSATFASVMAAIVIGYVAQRLIEGVYLKWLGMDMHVWQRFDSRFRLITARRNPNMAILFFSLIFARPDLGIIAVAVWTIVSLVIHAIRLAQALSERRRRGPLVSWLQEA